MFRSMPWYLPLMIVLTACYVSLEVPFLLYLSHILGGNTPIDDIHRVEKVGRVFSGIAVAIAVLGMWHFPRMERLFESRARSVFLAVVFSGIATFGTYMALDFYANARGWYSSGQERKEAVLAMMAKQTLSETGMNGTMAISQDSWNGFVATMPVIMNSASMLAKSGKSVSDLVAREADNSIGDPAAFKSSFFDEHFSQVKNSYQTYKDASDQITYERDHIDQRANQAWSDFASELNRRYPNGWPNRGWSHGMIVRKVRLEQKIPVSTEWSIRDRGSFVAAVKEKIRGEIVDKYTASIRAALGPNAELMPNLSYAQFLQNPAVQKTVHDNISSIDVPAGAVISPDMSQKAFDAAIVDPQRARFAKNFASDLAEPASAYERGTLAQRGMDAVKSVQLPALAILLSVTGAIVHIFKLTGYSVGFMGYLTRIRLLQTGMARNAVAAAIVAISGHFLLGIGTDSFKTPEISRISTGGIYATFLEGAVSLQPQLAQVGEPLGKFGPWQIVASTLPTAHPYMLAVAAKAPPAPADGIDGTQVASIGIDDVAAPAADAQDIEIAQVPVPLAKPAR